MKQVTLKSGPHPLVQNIYVAEFGGKQYELPEGQQVEVPDEVAKSLGDAPGFKFQINSAKEKK